MQKKPEQNQQSAMTQKQLPPLQRAPDTSLLAFAQSLTDLSGPLCRNYFRHPLAVDLKADASPVTVADRTVEAELRETIQSAYPDHGIYGEEHGREPGNSSYVWVLDPIDGTKSFITGMPTFGTLIALLKDDNPMIGIIDIPATNERWVGTHGRTTLFNGAVCRTRACQRLSQAHVYTTSPDMFNASDGIIFDDISRQGAMRRFGGDCYSYGLLASGHIDVVIETSLEPYDFMALVPVIEGAGGKITDWEGNKLGLSSDGRVIAAGTSELHTEIISRIKGLTP